MEADKRLELTQQDHRHRHRRVRHRRSRTSSSTRSRCRSAPTPTVVNDDAGDDRADPRRVRRQHDARRLQRVVRHAGPARARRVVPADGDDGRADQRDHGRPHAADRRGGPGRRPAARQRRVGRRPGSRRTARSRPRPPMPRTAAGRPRADRPRRRPPPARRPTPRGAARAGPGPASASTPASRPREVRVPAGVSVFDAASWNGIAIDSTCGGHGTCKKCKVQVLGATCRSTGSTRGRSPATSCGRLAAGLPASRPTQDLGSTCRR